MSEANNAKPEMQSECQEIIMKTVLATLVFALTLSAVALPVSAAFVAPDASWQTKAFANGY